MSESADISKAPPLPPHEWAIVELMGHRQHAGRISEVTRFGTVLLRIDVPVLDGDGHGFVTVFACGSSIYGLRPVTEAVARAAASRMSDPRPVDPAGYRPAFQYRAHGEDGDDRDVY